MWCGVVEMVDGMIYMLMVWCFEYVDEISVRGYSLVNIVMGWCVGMDFGNVVCGLVEFEWDYILVDMIVDYCLVVVLF